MKQISLVCFIKKAFLKTIITCQLWYAVQQIIVTIHLGMCVLSFPNLHLKPYNAVSLNMYGVVCYTPDIAVFPQIVLHAS